MITTVESLPDSYSNSCDIVLNDWDWDIVARNIVLLLIALHIDRKTAPLVMLHIWYSAFVPRSLLQILQKDILPLINEVCDKIKNREASSLQSKKWRFGRVTMRVTLPKLNWDNLQSFFDNPAGFTSETALKLRQLVTLAQHRKDYVDRSLNEKPPAWRLCTKDFRVHGLLLPLGTPRGAFDTPNP